MILTDGGQSLGRLQGVLRVVTSILNSNGGNVQVVYWILVMRVSQVLNRLLVCDLDSALSVSVLTSRNVSLIVNASGLEDIAYPPLDGLQVLHVPVQDQPHAPLNQYFDPVAERIHQNQEGVTLVHCMAGRSRSPALVMAYLMRFEGLRLHQAHELVLSQRPFIRPNAGFWRQLQDYERRLFGTSSIRMRSTSAGVLPQALQNLKPDHSVEDSDCSAAYLINI